jgi:hypothetical protein
MQRDVAQRQRLARYLLYRRAELNAMNEPSGWWTGQRIGGWDEKGHWRSSASTMASVLHMKVVS